MRSSRLLFLVAMFLSSAACGGPPPTAPPLPATVATGGQAPAQRPKPSIGAWGFDLSGMNRSVKPGDDFFTYASGTWAKTTTIPPDRSRYGAFDQLGEKSEADVHTLLEELGDGAGEPGSPTRKVADFYWTFLDTGAIEAAGL